MIISSIDETDKTSCHQKQMNCKDRKENLLYFVFSKQDQKMILYSNDQNDQSS